MARQIPNPVAAFTGALAAPGVGGPTAAPRSRRRPVWFWLVIALGLLLLVLLSSCTGFATGMLANPHAAAGTVPLEELETAQLERDAAVTAQRGAETRVSELEDEVAAMRTDLAAAGSEESQARSALVELESEHEASLGRIADLEARIAELEEQGRAAGDARPAPAADPGSGSSATSEAGSAAPAASAYYANCAAARAAGQAPLYAGEAGYRAGLDRDGDGIACE